MHSHQLNELFYHIKLKLPLALEFDVYHSRTITPRYTTGVDRHLEVASRSEGEAGQLSLLGAPALRQEGVPDEDAFVQTRVQMKSDAAAGRSSQVHTETENHRKRKKVSDRFSFSGRA